VTTDVTTVAGFLRNQERRRGEGLSFEEYWPRRSRLAQVLAFAG
jgi:hypothetical protein